MRIAGDEMDEAIVQYIKKHYNLLVGERRAEEIKIKLGSAYPMGGERRTMEVKGRDLIDGIPKTIVITDEEIREALREPVMTIVETVRTCLERTPPELAADIVDKGIVLTGGGALLRGLDHLLRQETNLPVTRGRRSAVLRRARHRQGARRARSAEEGGDPGLTPEPACSPGGSKVKIRALVLLGIVAGSLPAALTDAPDARALRLAPTRSPSSPRPSRARSSRVNRSAVGMWSTYLDWKNVRAENRRLRDEAQQLRVEPLQVTETVEGEHAAAPAARLKEAAAAGDAVGRDHRARVGRLGPLAHRQPRPRRPGGRA